MERYAINFEKCLDRLALGCVTRCCFASCVLGSGALSAAEDCRYPVFQIHIGLKSDSKRSDVTYKYCDSLASIPARNGTEGGSGGIDWRSVCGER